MRATTEGTGAEISSGGIATVVAAWQAHTTCVLHAEFVVVGAGAGAASGLLLVTACPAAELRVWRVQGDCGTARLVRRMQLVPRPQRMAALRCSCPQGSAVPWLLCGGSAGALAACRLSADAEATEADVDDTPLLSPTTSLPHAHAEQAVSDALARRADAAAAAVGGGGDEVAASCDVCVYSCGRNGTVNEYAAAVAAPSQGDACAVELSALRSWRCPGANFLERLLPSGDGDFVVMAFLQAEMMLWKLQARQQLYRLRCHGYRHPKHLLWSANDAEQGEPRFHFGYATGSCLHLHGTPPQTAASAVATLSAPCSLTPSLHGREVLAALALPSSLHAEAPLGGARKACLFATGSEDNEVRILCCETCEVGGAPDVLQPPRCLATLQGHPAAVRALALSCPADGTEPAVLFSAGGKEAIHCWQLPRHAPPTVRTPAEQHELRPSLICARVLPERNAAKALDTLRTEAEADARYLSAAALHLPSGPLAAAAAADGKPPSAHLLAAGTSNAHIELHVLGSRRRALLPLARLASQGGLALCLALQRTPGTDGVSGGADEVLLVAGDSGGAVTVWRLRSVLGSGLASLAAESVRRAGAAVPPAMTELQPSCRLALHAMGVNCLSIAWLPGGSSGDGGSRQLAVVTGGDDQALGACLLHISAAANGGEGDGIVLHYGGIRQGAHGASIRGLACTHGTSCVYSSGPDQRLKAWEIDWSAMALQPQGRAVRTLGVGGEAPLSLLRLSAECAVATSHTYALCAHEWGKAEAGGDRAAVVVVGHGVQAVVVSGLQVLW